MSSCYSFFFCDDTATTEIYTLSLHDALPISRSMPPSGRCITASPNLTIRSFGARRDRKSTRLNSSHTVISYAVFCLKKKKKRKTQTTEKSRATTKSPQLAPAYTHPAYINPET